MFQTIWIFSDRLALTLTLKDPEELPDLVRSASNIGAFAALDEQSSKCGKFVPLKNVAIAFAYRTQQIVCKRSAFGAPQFGRKIFTGRMSELAALFELVRGVNLCLATTQKRTPGFHRALKRAIGLSKCDSVVRTPKTLCWRNRHPR